MALTKVDQGLLFPIQVVTGGNHGQFVAGSPFDCSTMFAASFYVSFAPLSTAASQLETEWRIECSETSDGDSTHDVWTPIYSRLTTVDSPVNPNVNTGTAGTNTLIVNSNAGLAAGQIIFLKNGTIANSEWHEIVDVNGTTITLAQNLRFNQNGTGNLWNAGLRMSIDLPLNSRREYRFAVNNNRGNPGSTAHRDVAFKCTHTTLTAVS